MHRRLLKMLKKPTTHPFIFPKKAFNKTLFTTTTLLLNKNNSFTLFLRYAKNCKLYDE
jgi:hypothetical protein